MVMDDPVTSPVISVRRDPAWLARIGVAAIAFTVPFAFAVGVGGDRSGFADRASAALEQAPEWAVTSIVSTVQVVFGFLTVAFFVTLASSRRWRRVLTALAAGAVTAASIVTIWAISGTDFIILNAPDRPLSGTGAAFPSLIGLGVLSSMVWTDRPWRGQFESRAAVVVITVGAITRELVSLTDPLVLLSVLAVAWLSSRVVSAAAGTPDPRPDPADVAQALERFGIHLRDVVPDGRNVTDLFGYRARTVDGRPYYVKILHRGGWRSLLIVRIYRALRFVDPVDSHPFRSLGYRVEHEALCTLKAASDGVPTPRISVVTPFGRGAMLLAFEAGEFRLLNVLDDDELTDDLLYRLWEAVAELRATRTAHRQLRLSSFVIDTDSKVQIIEFSAAQLGADFDALGLDVAEMLSSVAARVGATRAVRSARAVLGVSTLAGALPNLQALALSDLTRREVAASCGIDAIASEVRLAVGISEEAVQLSRLERIRPATLAIVATSTVGVALLVPQLLGSTNVWTQMAHADLLWVGVALVASFATYAGAAWAFDGAVPGRLPFWSNLELQLATSFVGILTTAASLAVSTRYLQRRGIGLATSAASVALNSAAGVLVHFGLLGAFLLMGGTSQLKGFSLPGGTVLLIVVAVIAAMALLTAIIAPARSFATQRLIPPVRNSLHGLGELVSQPAKLAEVVGGSAVVTLGYILALYAACLAIAPDSRATALVPVALVYLIGSVVASAAPTPGGLGAVEAALVAGLTSGGLAAGSALGAVLIYRGLTFWLPILPGWFSFASLQRRREL